MCFRITYSSSILLHHDWSVQVADNRLGIIDVQMWAVMCQCIHLTSESCGSSERERFSVSKFEILSRFTWNSFISRDQSFFFSWYGYNFKNLKPVFVWLYNATLKATWYLFSSEKICIFFLVCYTWYNHVEHIYKPPAATALWYCKKSQF